MVDEGHNGRIYEPTGPESLLPAEQLRILGQVFHRDLRLQPQPDDEARAEMIETTPPEYVDAFFDFHAAGSLEKSRVTTTVRDVT